MKISDFENNYEVSTIEELRTVLAKRYPANGSQANSFWLGHASQFPLMSILVKDELATLWYSGEENDPGSNSIGNVAGLSSGEGTVFYLSGEGQWMPNESVISVSGALQAAEEFLASGTRPRSVRWLDLRSH